MRSLLIASLLIGCTENSFNKIDNGNGGDGAEIEVEPDWLSFGTVGYDDDPVVQSFMLRSVGTTTLDIEGMTIGGEDAASFTIISPNTSMSLEPEEEATFEVAFEPLGANSQVGQVQIASNDQANPTATVDLVGDGAVPELQISPDPLDFGDSYVGCYKENEATLTNIGTSDLVIDSMSWEGDAEMSWISTGFTFPLTLAPGEETTTYFSFNPVYDVDHEGMLLVTSFLTMGVLGLQLLVPFGVPLWASSLAIFVLAWVGQFIGHKIEGKKPSFFEDLQFLMIGPLWLLGHIYRERGIRY